MNLEPLSTDQLRKRLAGLRTRRTQWATRVWIHGIICLAFCVIAALYSQCGQSDGTAWIYAIIAVSGAVTLYHLIRGCGDCMFDAICDELARRFEAGK